MPSNPVALSALQRRIWDGRLPLEIRLAPTDCRTYANSEPYLIQFPRLSYLAFLLPRLHAFFAPKLINPDTPFNEAWFEFDTVPLKWHYPVGLLYDIHSGAEPADMGRRLPLETSQTSITPASDSNSPLPMRLVLHYSEFPSEHLIQLDLEGRAMLDSFVNAVKEADFIRNGNARTVMGMSKEDSDNLWKSVQAHDIDLFNSVNNKLLNPPGVTLRHVPMKLYLPTSASQGTSQTIPEAPSEDDAPAATGRAGHIRVVQALIPLLQASKQPQTLGTALNSILKSIFPSRRTPLLAQPVLHGAVAPMSANLAELGRVASFGDGFLHISINMMG
ncbi:hypothetical protein Q7P37_002659 [Cladosporium fusiforme]